ncbi:MAG: phosphotransferase family protein [Steroidobacteraceae bacterium]
MTNTPENFAPMRPEVARQYLLTLATALREAASTDSPDHLVDVARQSSRVLVRVAHLLAALPADKLDGLKSSAGLAGEGELLDFLERQLSALHEAVQATTEQRAFDASNYIAHLHKHGEPFSTMKLESAKELRGGRAKRTVLLHCKSLDGNDADWVLRQDLPSEWPRTSVTFEYGLLQALSQAGLQVPRPALLETNAGELGLPFMLVEKLPGRPPGDLYRPPKSAHLAQQFATLLGALHGLSVNRVAHLPDLKTKIYSQTDLRETLAWYRDIYVRLDDPSATISSIFAWLERTVSEVEGPLAVVHGDVGFHNMLVHDGMITGLLDWEEAHLGNPAEDVGYCRGDIEQMMDWPTFMETYRSSGGPMLSVAAIDFYSLLGEVKVYCSVLLARENVETGKTRYLSLAECIVDWAPVLRQRMSQRIRGLSS